MRIIVLGHAIELECQPHEQKRLEDLAAALNTRLAGVTGDPDAVRRLTLAALALMDEAQAANAALARARYEIERLTDMLVEAKLEAGDTEPSAPERGRVGALRRVAEGAA
jgi:cell division protein ZapA (FtsZ GTPase activity inhibitor)